MDEKLSRDFDGHLKLEKQKWMFIAHEGLGVCPGKPWMLKLEPHSAVP